MLYKYRPLNNFCIRLIVNGELYFAAPSMLNDPLDCTFQSNTVLKKVESTADKQVSLLLNDVIDRIFSDKITGVQDKIFCAVENRANKAGILSFSMTAKDPLIWSHYAKGHTGICIGIEREFLENFIEREWKKNKLIGGQPVLYKDIPSFDEIITWYLKRELQGRPIEIDKLFVDLIMPVLTTKSVHWKYEEEYRVIRSEPGTINIPRKAIKKVIVGRKISKGDFLLVKSLLADPALKHVNLYKADFTENSFSMDIVHV